MIDIREVVEHRELERLPDDLSTLVPWLQNESPNDFARVYGYTSSVSAPDCAVDALDLRMAAKSFHATAGTLSPPIERQIELIGRRGIARLAHQPNLLPYARLVHQFQVLNEVSETADAVPLYYFIDYDSLSNVRFGRAQLPDPSAGSGFRFLTLGNRYRKHRTAIYRNLPAPGYPWVRRTLDALKHIMPTYALHGRDSDDELLGRLGDVSELLREVYGTIGSLSERNAVFLSRLVNDILDIPIVFVPGSELWRMVDTGVIVDILSQWPAFRNGIATVAERLNSAGVQVRTVDVLPFEGLLPLWAICPCGSRVPVSLLSPAPGIRFHECGHCGQVEARIDLGLADLVSELRDRIVPRVALHNALNVIGFGYALGVGYTGGAQHILVHSLALARLGHPVLPQYLSCARGSFGSSLEVEVDNPSNRGLIQAQRLVRSGYASCLYHLIATPWEQLSFIPMPAEKRSDHGGSESGHF